MHCMCVLCFKHNRSFFFLEHAIGPGPAQIPGEGQRQISQSFWAEILIQFWSRDNGEVQRKTASHCTYARCADSAD